MELDAPLVPPTAFSPAAMPLSSRSPTRSPVPTCPSLSPSPTPTSMFEIEELADTDADADGFEVLHGEFEEPPENCPHHAYRLRGFGDYGGGDSEMSDSEGQASMFRKLQRLSTSVGGGGGLGGGKKKRSYAESLESDREEGPWDSGESPGGWSDAGAGSGSEGGRITRRRLDRTGRSAQGSADRRTPDIWMEMDM